MVEELIVLLHRLPQARAQSGRHFDLYVSRLKALLVTQRENSQPPALDPVAARLLSACQLRVSMLPRVIYRTIEGVDAERDPAAS